MRACWRRLFPCECQETLTWTLIWSLPFFESENEIGSCLAVEQDSCFDFCCDYLAFFLVRHRLVFLDLSPFHRDFDPFLQWGSYCDSCFDHEEGFGFCFDCGSCSDSCFDTICAKNT